MIEPRSVVKSIRLDNEYISLPVTDRVSQHSRIGIFRELASIGPDLSMDVVPVEQLKHTAGNLNEFEVPRIVFQKQQARYSQRIAISHRIVS